MGATKRLFIQEQLRRDALIEDTKIVEVNATLLKHSRRAILIQVLVVVLKVKVWIPKSQIVSPDPIRLELIEPGDELQLYVPLWLAKTNNLTSQRR